MALKLGPELMLWDHLHLFRDGGKASYQQTSVCVCPTELAAITPCEIGGSGPLGKRALSSC